jgi:protoporphyrinogen oxidase
VDVAVIGAGPMGLACAQRLLQRGHSVRVYEADRVIGGMSASFDFDGLRIERFYHFICTGDAPYLEHIRELGLQDKLHWTNTRMGFYHGGRVQAWGDPLSLLRFRGISLWAKFRYGLMALASTRRRKWADLDRLDAASWLRAWCGEEGWRELWLPLFKYKFFQYTGNLSAAWIWARMRRVGTSRKSLFSERLGYLEGGSETWLAAIRAAIEAAGGRVSVSCRVDEVLIDGGAVKGVRCGESVFSHDAVISTVPLPFVPDMIPGLPEPVLEGYRRLENIAVVCVLVKLKRPLSPYFWMNISDGEMRIPGVIEYSNLCKLDQHLLYIPYYMPGDHPDYQQPDSDFLERSRRYMKKLNPELEDSDIITIGAGRYRFAQPICPPEFLQTLPPIDVGIAGLRIADTSHYYPEDRSISESIQLGRALAESVGEAGE